MSRIYQSESKANFQGSARGGNFQPKKAVDSSKALKEYKETLALNDAVRNRELTRRDRAETLQNNKQYTANQAQLALEAQADKVELEMDQLVLNNQVELDQLVEKQSLERQSDQLKLSESKTKTVFDTFDSLLKFGNSSLKYSDDMNIIREKEEKEAEKLKADNDKITNSEFLFDYDFDQNLGGASVVEQGAAQLVVENIEEQAIVDAAPNDPVAQERLRTGMGVNQTTARRNSQISVGEAAQQASGRLFGAFFDANTKVRLSSGELVSPTSVTDPTELSEVIRQLARQVTAEMGVGRGDRQDRLTAISLYVPSIKAAMLALESRMMGKVVSARQNNAELAGFTSAAQMLDRDVEAAFREYYSAAWTSGKYNGDKGKASKAALDKFILDADAGQLRELKEKPVYYNKDGTPGPLFKNDKRFATDGGSNLIDDAIDAIEDGLLDDNRRKEGVQQIELSNATNAFTAALMDAKTPEQTVQANQAFEAKLTELADAGNAKARDELANQRNIGDNYNPQNYQVLSEEIAQGVQYSEEFLTSRLAGGFINPAEFTALKQKGLATPANKEKVYGGKAAYDAINRSTEGAVSFALRERLGEVDPLIQQRFVASITNDIIKRRDLAVNAFLQRAPDAKPADVEAFAERWNKENIPNLTKQVELDKASGTITGYKRYGETELGVPSTAANGYKGLPTYSNPYTGKQGSDFSAQNLTSLRNSRESGYLSDLTSNKILTAGERSAAITAYATGENYPPSVIAKAEALNVEVNELIRQQAKGSGRTLGARPTQDIPVIRELDAGGPVSMQTGYQAIKALGVPPRGAAYLAGNIMAESSWDGMRDWGQVAGDGSDRNGGLISWMDDAEKDHWRLSNIEKYLGKPISQATHMEQLKAMLWEMEKDYKNEYRIFMNPNATQSQLRRASLYYWGYRDEGARFTYANQLMN